MAVKLKNKTHWLFENGGPVIRYRTATELLEKTYGIDLNKLKMNLLSSPQVLKWLGRFNPGIFHHGDNSAFENVIGKLTELGLHSGMLPLDKKTRPFRQWIADYAKLHEGMYLLFCKSLITAGLTRAGYTNDKPLKDFLRGRLDTLYEHACRKTYDIYVDPKELSHVPKAFSGKPIIRPGLCAEGDFRLPFIHDIYAMAYFPDDMRDKSTDGKISAIIQHILHPDYQSLPENYGYFCEEWDCKPKWYAIGWSIHLPGFNGFKFDDFHAGMFIQRLELMAHFPMARKTRWFRESMNHLEGYRTERDTYLFPRKYLKEQMSGYYVTGAYMGLEEDRRSRESIEIESTFRMLKIKKLMQDGR